MNFLIDLILRIVIKFFEQFLSNCIKNNKLKILIIKTKKIVR